MRTEKQRANLRRGSSPGNVEGAARARAAKREHEARDEELAQAVREDPKAALAELHADLVRGTRYLTRRWLNSKGEPSRELMQAWRELRILSEQIMALREDRGPEEEAARFFAQLDDRMRNINDRVFDQAKPLTLTGP
jgi:hypothetical protein